MKSITRRVYSSLSTEAMNEDDVIVAEQKYSSHVSDEHIFLPLGLYYW